MLSGHAGDVKRHAWFAGLDWQALAARKMEAPRTPRDDSAKRLKELTVPPPAFVVFCSPDGLHVDLLCQVWI